MSQNWQCSNCQAYNPTRRNACWQCKHVRAPIRSQIKPPEEEAHHQKSYLPPLRFPTSADLIYRYHLEKEKKRKREERFLAFGFGIAAGIGSIFILTNPLSSPSQPFRLVNLVGGFVLFLIGQLLVFIATRPRWRLFVLQFSLIVTFGLVYGFILERNRVDGDLVAAAGMVCNGERLPQATAYQLQVVPHHILVIYQSSKQSLLINDYPPNWIPEQIEGLQLVACLEYTWDLIERCEYERNHIMEREQYVMSVTLRSAWDGQVVNRFQLHGEAPSDCSTYEIFEGNEFTKTVRGSEIDLPRLMDQLRSYVIQGEGTN